MRREEKVGEEKSYGNRLIGIAGFARLSMAFGVLDIRDTGHGASRSGIRAMYDRHNGGRHTIIFRTGYETLRDKIRMPKHTTGARCQSITLIRWTSSTQISPAVLNHLLFPTLPNPLLILLPLPLNIPESLPPLPFPTNPAIQTQKRIRIALTQHLLALFCVVALAVSSFPRDLARPLCVLYWL